MGSSARDDGCIGVRFTRSSTAYEAVSKSGQYLKVVP